MATKNCDLSLRNDKTFVNVSSFSNQDSQQYSNLNLNANQKNSTFNPVHSKSEATHSKSTKNYNATIKALDQIVDKNDFSTKNNSWSTTHKSLRKNGLNLLESQENDTKNQRWKNYGTSSLKKSSSTLSLHIAAYENSVAKVEGGEIGQDKSVESSKLKKTSKKGQTSKTVKEVLSTPSLMNAFEIPRQQEEATTAAAAAPEVSQFKTSQRLLNPNAKHNENFVSNSETLEGLVHVMCELQHAWDSLGIETAIQFPQIVVVGSQSAGKSSVIEGLVGIDFLPRGTEIVTRCPLLINLIHTPMNDPQRKQNGGFISGDWAVFGHLPDNTFTDFLNVREEIGKQTDKLVGANKGISTKPIYLKIYSENVLNLTLIDLPGITKVPIGDQPADIEKLVREMIMEYISKENSLILAVTSAVNDLATSESLKLAQEVDKNGDRTICVLTKLDMMDEGTDAKKALMGEVIRVKLGVVGVVGRSQKDINSNKSVKECLKNEKAFLEKNYPELASKNGIPNLARTLNKQLLEAIREKLPENKEFITKRMGKCNAELRSLKEPIAESEKPARMYTLINRFLQVFIKLINGQFEVIVTSKIAGGARILDVIYDTYAKEMEKINPMLGLTDTEILMATKNAQGFTPAMCLNQDVFQQLYSKQMRMLLEPSLKCVDSIYESLLQIIDDCETQMQSDMLRFPRLFDYLKEEITSYLKGQINPAKDFVDTLIRCQRAHFNTLHPHFKAAIEKIDEKNEFLQKDGTNVSGATGQQQLESSDSAAAAQQQPRNVSEDLSLKRTKSWIEAYFGIILIIVQDTIPKAAIEFLVKKMEDHLLASIIMDIQKPEKAEKVNDLLKESAQLAHCREKIENELYLLEKTNDVFKKVDESFIL